MIVRFKRPVKTLLVFISLFAISLISSCFFGGDSDPDPSDPCDNVECNEPYEKPVATASTVCQCQCANGFSGPDCTEFDHGNCDYVVCLNGGTKNKDGDYCYCSCPPGWGGEFCEIPVNACSGVECPEGQSPDPELDCECV